MDGEGKRGAAEEQSDTTVEGGQSGVAIEEQSSAEEQVAGLALVAARDAKERQRGLGVPGNAGDDCDGEDAPSFTEVACEVFLHPVSDNAGSKFRSPNIKIQQALQTNAKGAILAFSAKAKALHSQSSAAVSALKAHQLPTVSGLTKQLPTVSDLSKQLPDVSGFSKKIPTVSDISKKIPTVSDISTTIRNDISNISGMFKSAASPIFRFAPEESPRSNAPAAGSHLCKFSVLPPATGDRGQAHSFDTNGVLFYIGTVGGTSEYANPHSSFDSTAIAKLSSVLNNSETNGTPDRFVMHSHDGSSPNVTKDETGQWMSIDLGKGCSLVPNHYCLRHGRRNGAARLRSWRLEGSHDDSTWTALREHTDDESLPEQAYGVADWEVEGVVDAYRHFRIAQTGPDSSGTNRLACAGLELYGELRGTTNATVPIDSGELIERWSFQCLILLAVCR
jgi:hypothetical protein